MASIASERSGPAILRNINVNEVTLARRDYNHLGKTAPEGKPPQEPHFWGHATSSITYAGTMPASLAVLSGANAFTYRIAGRFTEDGISPNRVLEEGILDADGMALAYAIRRMPLDDGARLWSDTIPRLKEWRAISDAGIPFAHQEPIADLIRAIANDYFQRSWAAGLPPGSGHSIYGKISRYMARTPNPANLYEPYIDSAAHVDFFDRRVPAIGYFGADNNPTTFYSGSFRYLGDAVVDYAAKLPMQARPPGTELSQVRGTPGALYRTNDVRTLIHRSNITHDGYRTFIRFFVGPGIEDAIRMRERADHVLTEELAACLVRAARQPD